MEGRGGGELMSWRGGGLILVRKGPLPILPGVVNPYPRPPPSWHSVRSNLWPSLFLIRSQPCMRRSQSLDCAKRSMQRSGAGAAVGARNSFYQSRTRDLLSGRADYSRFDGPPEPFALNKEYDNGPFSARRPRS